MNYRSIQVFLSYTSAKDMWCTVSNVSTDGTALTVKTERKQKKKTHGRIVKTTHLRFIF